MQIHADLQKLTKKDLVEFYLGKVASAGKDRKALIVSSTSQQHSEVFELADGHVLIEDVVAEKGRLQVSMLCCNSIDL